MSSSDDPISSLPHPPASHQAFDARPSSALSNSGSTSTSSSSPQTFHDATTNPMAVPSFPPAEEASLLAESGTLKSQANSLFSQKRYSEAISTYDRALASCPNYLEYEVAVLKSNVSACHLQLEEWKEAVERATEALDGLDRLAPLDDTSDEKGEDKETTTKQGKNAHPHQQNGTPRHDEVVEIPPDEDESAALHRLSLSDARKSDIERIRIKSLLRRARARHKQQTWSSLAGAQEDYNLLLTLLTSKTSNTNTTKAPSTTSPADLKTVRSALAALPSQINTAKEKEMGEMMGKLKDLGNGILKPFGLSTDNFKMVKDEKTGGYSMNFEGNQ